jgi:predicted ATP-grasp superfamily ATP-dependent carboligase
MRGCFFSNYCQESQGDQIGRFFASWVIVYMLWAVFLSQNQVPEICGLPVYTVKALHSKIAQK